MGTTLKVINTTLSLHEDLPKYTTAYYEIQDSLEEATRTINREDDISRLLSCCDDIIKNNTNAIVQKLVNVGIYDYTYEQLRGVNPGVGRMMEAFSAYASHMEGVSNRTAAAAQSELSRAADEAASQIHGMQFGILTSSIVSMMIYDAFNESEIKKSTEQAQGYLDAQKNRILRQKDDADSRASSKYIRETLKPSLESGLVEFFSALLGQYMKALSANNLIDLNCIRGIDEVKSSRMIDNIHLASDKLDLLEKAAVLCPYNARVYSYAYKYGVLGDELGRIVQSLNCTGLTKRILVDIWDESGIQSDSSFNKLNSRIDGLYEKYKYAVTALSCITGNTEKNIFGGYVKNLLRLKADAVRKYVSALKSGKPENVLAFLGAHPEKMDIRDRSMVSKSVVSSYLRQSEYDCAREHTDIDINAILSQSSGTSIVSYASLKSYSEQLIDEVMPAINAEIDRRNQEVAKQKAELERQAIEKEKKEKELEAKSRRRNIILGISSAALIVIIILVITVPAKIKQRRIENHYNTALQIAENTGDLDKALLEIEQVRGICDPAIFEQYINEIKYQYAVNLNNSKSFKTAYDTFTSLGTYKDSERLAETVFISYADSLMESEDPDDINEAIHIFSDKDMQEQLQNAYTKKCCILANNGDYIQALDIARSRNLQSQPELKELGLFLVQQYCDSENYYEAANIGIEFSVESEAFYKSCIASIEASMDSKDYTTALKYLNAIQSFPEAQEYISSVGDQAYYIIAVDQAKRGDLLDAAANLEKISPGFKSRDKLLSLCRQYEQYNGVWEIEKGVVLKKGVGGYIEIENEGYKRESGLDILITISEDMATGIIIKPDTPLLPYLSDFKDVTFDGSIISWKEDYHNSRFDINTGIREDTFESTDSYGNPVRCRIYYSKPNQNKTY